MGNDPFSQATFTAPAERCEFVARLLLDHAPARPELRVLDVGCGTGNLLFHLAGRVPTARLTGVDLSGGNIAAALRRRDELRLAERARFVQADFLAMERGAYDVIVSDSTLQYVQGDSLTLFRLLESDLSAGGVLLVNMPYACPYNSFLYAARRILRAASGPAMDRFIYALGKLLHGSEVPDELLRERVGYMYLLPRRIFSPDLYGTVALNTSLRRIETHRLPHASLAQPKHELTVFRKKA